MQGRRRQRGFILVSLLAWLKTEKIIYNNDNKGSWDLEIHDCQCCGATFPDCNDRFGISRLFLVEVKTSMYNFCDPTQVENEYLTFQKKILSVCQNDASV